MKAELYLSNISFENNAFEAISDVENAIVRLADDYDFIRQFGDAVFKHESIYDTEILPGHTLLNLLYTDEPSPLSRDVTRNLLKIIDHSAVTQWSNAEIIELIVNQEVESLCEEGRIYGLLALNNTSHTVPETFTVYNRQNLLDFHRFFLTRFPCNENYFLEQCTKCFPSLFFHEQVVATITTMEGGWRNFARSIISHLVYLNDVFPKYLVGAGYQRVEALLQFSSDCNIDVTTQGNAGDKRYMTFSFTDKTGRLTDVCCEPHMKLYSSDLGGDTHHYFNRIYFHEGNNIIQGGRILVGYIGQHINFS